MRQSSLQKAAVLYLFFSLCICTSVLAYVQGNITLDVRDASADQVFKELKRQTGYSFLYTDDVVVALSKITIKIRNARLEEVLTKMFNGSRFTYNIVDKVVIIRSGETQKKGDSIKQQEDNPGGSSINISGKVINDKNELMRGATVSVKGTDITALTDENGQFVLNNIEEDAVLAVSFVGYETVEISVEGKTQIVVQLKMIAGELGLVTISTGYAELPKDRATGSFAKVDNALFNRRVSSDVLSRLDGVTSGLIFNNNTNRQFAQSDITIRGRSTIFGNANPLIVIDNFPYDGNINSINPNDIEHITILKDAAAASIWGVRAGNGVIVITTKKGRLNQKPAIAFNSNVTIGEKPDLFYQPQLTSSQFIDVETFLWNSGKYDIFTQIPVLNYWPISPVIDILDKQRRGEITDVQANAQLDQLRNHDVRDDQNRYFYRSSVAQQYALNVSGGGLHNKYYISAGYDRSLSNRKPNEFDRFTLTATNSYKILNDKLEINAGILYTNTRNKSNVSMYNPENAAFPYQRLADENGNPLPVTTSNIRFSYADTAGGGKLLDWRLRPLNEMDQNASTSLFDFTLRAGVSYQITKGLSVSLNYQYGKGVRDGTTLYDRQSFFVRDLVNTFTQLNRETGEMIRPIPYGSILDVNNSNYQSHNGRAQVNYNTIFKDKYELNVLGGYEVKDYKFTDNSTRLYGYDEETASHFPVDYTTLFPSFYGFSMSRIADGSDRSGVLDRFVSYYSSAAFTYDRRYTISASARKDESNLFGVKSNQKGVPLWSVGLAWNVARETFYKSSFLSELRLRATYGYNGNVDKSTTAFLTVSPQVYFNSYNQYQTLIVNPPNPSLRWERIRNINFGIDYSLVKNAISGSVEYWIKEGFDLIGNSPIAPQTGVEVLRGNFADTRSRGWDVVLNSNIIDKKFRWSAALLFNYISEKVTNYKVKQGSNLSIVNGNYNNPLEGYPYYSIFSFPTDGLDTLGNPVGIFNGLKSTDFATILNSTDASQIVYSGPATPKYFGSLRNTFSYKMLELSVNIVYKAGYFFRRNSLSNSQLYSEIYQQEDYEKRWQKPGDELTTTVPSLIYPADFSRDLLYQFSQVLVEKADHVRLQDIQLACNFDKSRWAGLPFNNLKIYAYINNIGIIWKANDKGIDPDFPRGFPNPRTYSVGLNMNF